MKRGNWTDDPCWYCTVRDGARTAYLLGPFSTEAACRQWAYYEKDFGGDHAKHYKLMTEVSRRYGARVHFYAYGMAKVTPGHREGIMNKDLPEAEREFYSTLCETGV